MEFMWTNDNSSRYDIVYLLVCDISNHVVLTVKIEMERDLFWIISEITYEWINSYTMYKTTWNHVYLGGKIKCFWNMEQKQFIIEQIWRNFPLVNLNWVGFDIVERV